MSRSETAHDGRWTRGGPAKDGAATILVGVDGSCTSMRAAAYAAGLARRQQARLVVAHVLRQPAGSVAFPYPLEVTIDVDQQQAHELQQQLSAEIECSGVDMVFVAVRGEPGGELSWLARECGAELVVVGASESRWHRLVGSLPSRLIRARRVPVVVVP